MKPKTKIPAALRLYGKLPDKIKRSLEQMDIAHPGFVDFWLQATMRKRKAQVHNKQDELEKVLREEREYFRSLLASDQQSNVKSQKDIKHDLEEAEEYLVKEMAKEGN